MTALRKLAREALDAWDAALNEISDDGSHRHSRWQRWSRLHWRLAEANGGVPLEPHEIREMLGIAGPILTSQGK